MCGIAGIVDFHNNKPGIDIVKSMLQSISYRGPDECGIYHSQNATMGNVRLSIIDLVSGQQPLSDLTDRYWIIFNGEIFNFKELRQELEKDGSKLRTQSDTEVLVQLYSRYGKECLGKLNGQFAFAIWDEKKQTLFAARDRLGQKPLYYANRNGELLFASEINLTKFLLKFSFKLVS